MARARGGGEDKGRRFALAGRDQSPLSQAIRARTSIAARDMARLTTARSRSRSGAARPGVVHGHGHAEIDRLRAELEELTGKPVQLHLVQEEPRPQQSPGDARTGRPG